MASLRTLVDGEPRVACRLVLDIRENGAELSDAHASQIVSLGPPQRRPRHEPVPIRESRARTLQSLDKPRDVRDRRKLQNHVDVIRHDARRE